MRLVGANGEQLGIITVENALKKAAEAKLDLVLVADKTVPPVCRILDFGKLCYEHRRKQKNQKRNQAAQKLKEIRFHVNTDSHDYGYKMEHASEFLKKGNKVKISLVFRGREAAHKEMGFSIVEKAVKDLEGVGVAEGKPVLAGKAIIATLNPAK